MKRQVAMFMVCGVAVSAGMMMAVGQAAAGPSDPAPASPPRIVAGLDEPLVPTRPTSADEDSSLETAIVAFRVAAAIAPADAAFYLSPLAHFASTYPHSGWRAAVLGDLGFAYYRAGYVARALESWQGAWQEGRSASDVNAAAFVDRVVGELARVRARLGHADELDRLLGEVGGRPLHGPATEAMTAAREDAWQMRSDPAIAALCGPIALENLLLARGAPRDAVAFLEDEQAGRRGFSLAQLASLAGRAQLRARVIHREPGQAVPVPSVAHWSVRHFAAIVGQRDDGYLLKDPTLGAGTDERWVGRNAIDSETSGFFLVPADARQDPAWRVATAAEAEQIHGIGLTATRQLGATTPEDAAIYPIGGDDAGQGTGTGVAVYNAHTMLASLRLQITQTGYTSLKGPPAHIRLAYNQREAGQPATFGYFNVGPKWTLNVLSYVQDHPATPGTDVLRVVAGGGSVSYPTSGGPYDRTTGAFGPDPRTRGVLVRIPATGAVTSYELRMLDGSKHVFSQFDTATTAPRRVFLTQIVDPSGNALTLHYDEQLRLRTLRDAAGRTTRFGYEQADHPLRVTRITDPFGRSSTLNYLASGQLGSSTDATGTTSTFTYDDAGLIDSMTTPYGTTYFSHGLSPVVHSRFLEIVDPMGFAERIESFHEEPEDSFYWDKHALPLARATQGVAIDYSRARRLHWHPMVAATSPSASPEASGPPVKCSYNAAGQVLSVTDPDQRVTRYAYDSLGSLTTVTDPDGNTLLMLAYDAFDRIAATTDVMGYVLRYDYDDLDRLTRTAYPDDTFERYVYDKLDLVSVIDRRGQVTSYAYDANRRQTSLTDRLGRVTRFDYYNTGALKTLTDANGDVTTWGIDVQSRPTRQEATARPAASVVTGTMRLTAAPAALRASAVQAPIQGRLDRARRGFAAALLALLTVLSGLGLRAKARKMRAAAP